MLCDKCKKDSEKYGDIYYPYYGVAPHGHDLQKTGSFIGSTVVFPRHEWPDNFVEDSECPRCGIYYCPNPECENSKENSTIEKEG